MHQPTVIFKQFFFSHNFLLFIVIIDTLISLRTTRDRIQIKYFKSVFICHFDRLSQILLYQTLTDDFQVNKHVRIYTWCIIDRN